MSEAAGAEVVWIAAVRREPHRYSAVRSLGGGGGKAADGYNRPAVKGDFRSTRLLWILLLVLSIALGAGVAIASSPGSLAGGTAKAGAGGRATAQLGVPTAVPSPSPSPTALLKLGQLTAPMSLQVLGNRLYASGSGRSLVSSDDTTWTPLPAPSGGGPVVPDPSDPTRFVSGGSTVQLSTDGGKTWRRTLAAPPAGGPYQPLAISPADPAVWFILHQGRLARTRDGGVSWRDLPNLPDLGTSPVLVAGAAQGQFFLAVQGQVFELDDNGQQIQDRGQIPGGAAITGLVQGSAGTPGGLLAGTGAGAVFALRNGTWTDSQPPLAGQLGGTAGKLALLADGGSSVGVAGQVAFTTDAGQTWAMGTGLPADQSVLAAAAALDGQTAYAYCAAGDLYRSQDGGHTWALLSSSLRST